MHEAQFHTGLLKERSGTPAGFSRISEVHSGYWSCWLTFDFPEHSFVAPVYTIHGESSPQFRCGKQGIGSPWHLKGLGLWDGTVFRPGYLVSPTVVAKDKEPSPWRSSTNGE